MHNALSSACRSSSLLGCLLIAGFVSATAVGQSVEAADWPTYNYDFRGWRYNGVETRISPENASRLELKWRFPPEGSAEVLGAVNATPSVVNGYVYFGSSTHPKFYKLKPNGEVAWSYEPGDAGRRNQHKVQHLMGLAPRDGIYSSALVTTDRVYFSDVVGVAYCLDRKSGKEQWIVNTKAPEFPGAHYANMLMASPIWADGKVIFAGGAYEHASAKQKDLPCCFGRGFVMALDPRNGQVLWKYDVGPAPEKYDPPLAVQSAWGEQTYYYGPSTSSVWSTPSYDQPSNTIFFGTDVHNSPRKPTADDPRDYTPHSAAIIAVDAATGREKWIRQTNKHDIYNHSVPAYDPDTGYKDQSVGDTPKIFTLDIEGQPTLVVGAGAKSGGFYVMRADNGQLVAQTPVYAGPPSENPIVDPRTLALPGVIGGLQTGCATDGRRVYTNGNDNIFKGTAGRVYAPPTGGRVTSISLDTEVEYWRHERPKIAWIGGTEENPLFKNSGDPVSSGIAVANGCLFFTTYSSNKLVALNADTGELLKEIYLGPVLAGPSVSRGRVYIGTGNTQFVERDSEAYYPKSTTGIMYCFGIPGEDEIGRMGPGNE